MKDTLETTWSEKVKEFAGASESLGTLHPEILELAYTENWFKLFVPEAYGGPGKKLPEILRLEEKLAEADGSLGWTVTLCAGAAWFAGFLHPELAKEIFTDRNVCFAGSGAVGGTAIQTETGYQVSGHWKYASGALHATIFTANCELQDETGTALLNANGDPLVKSFILKKEEVEILPGWSYFGLVATGSHAFEVKDLWVPANRTFTINARIQVADEGFDYPFLQLAETTLAVNSSGMARHFLALVRESFQTRSGLKRYSEAEIDFFEQEFARCQQELEDVRKAFYNAFNASWLQLMEHQSIDAEIATNVSRLSRNLAHVSRKVADTLFPYCGLEAAKKETEINRVWRDLHTASQHALLTFELR